MTVLYPAVKHDEQWLSINAYAKDPSRYKDKIFCTCGAPMIARLGNINQHHFAHKSETDGKVCNSETYAHSFIKEALASVPKINMRNPAVRLMDGRSVTPFNSDQTSVTANVRSGATEVKVSGHNNDCFVDTVLKTDVGDIYFEIFVSNAKTSEHKSFYAEKGLTVFEIDASACKNDFGTDLLKKVFVKDNWHLICCDGEVVDQDCIAPLADFHISCDCKYHEDLRETTRIKEQKERDEKQKAQDEQREQALIIRNQKNAALARLMWLDRHQPSFSPAENRIYSLLEEGKCHISKLDNTPFSREDTDNAIIRFLHADVADHDWHFNYFLKEVSNDV